MKKYFNMIRPWDILIITILTIGSFLPLGIFYLNQEKTEVAPNQAAPQLIAYISVDGKPIKQITLTGHKGTDTYRYEDKDGDYNLLEIEDEHIQMIDANCGDLVCVRSFGPISKSGETILCLPHKLIVEVRSTDGKTDGGMVTLGESTQLLARN
ncbi:NusG domain II-containing protein [Carnobacterium gallinarum]|uniref:NusG domain II-containing protein n=1 Tax=Carnobacterium gallinarum TaxID=2749 RepID=UPI00055174C8|nr:NusG domain II-containing protein [Carnobacterium gallinarum]